MVEVLADRVGRTLIPSLLVARLLGGENVDEATAETVELISLLDVLMERRRIELRQDEIWLKPELRQLLIGMSTKR